MRRTICGMVEDSSETVALFVPDEQATDRIFAAADYYADEKKFRQKINNRLRHLSRPLRAFARAVLSGVTWREMGMAKQTFCFTLKKIEKILNGP